MNNPDRLLDISIPGISDTMLLTELTGEDYLSSLFYFKATVMIDNTTLPLVALIGQPVSIRIGRVTDEYKFYHGLVYDISRNEINHSYTLLICPQLRWLADTKASKVYAVKKPQTIPQIVSEILKNEAIDYKLELSRTYDPLTISVQYDESLFNYMSRLIEQAGIYYYFTHTDAKHTLVLTDNPFPQLGTPMTALHSSSTLSEAHINDWEHITNPALSSIQTQRYDFQQPSTLITDKQKNPHQTTGLPDFFSSSLFHYGGNRANSTTAQLKTADQHALQGSDLFANTVHAKSTYISMQAGTCFALTEHNIATEQGNYYIYAIAHQARDTSQTTLHIDGELPQLYKNHFFSYATSQAFVPQGRYQTKHFTNDNQLLSKHDATVPMLEIYTPSIPGLHTANVTAPKDKPIYTDKYGRLKVQFEWDTENQHDENSFAWTRLKQPLASQGFGVQATPRTSQQLLASFMDGDPDQPLLLNALPEDPSQLPFSPDKTPTQSGWQSRSLNAKAYQTPPGGHVLQFEDNAPQAAITLAAHRDLSLNVAGNLTGNMNSNIKTTVHEGNATHTIKGKLTITANKAVHWVNEQSRISITDSDIVVEADTIVVGKGS